MIDEKRAVEGTSVEDLNRCYPYFSIRKIKEGDTKSRF